MDWNPFHDYLLATGSEDSTIKVWSIPEGGPTENITTPVVDLHGHSRKVTLLSFNPTAGNVLLSTSADNTVKLWDIQRQMEMNTFNDHDQLVQDIAWDYRGNQYLTTNKDKKLRIVDARTATLAGAAEMIHEGAKSIKATFLGRLDRIATVGFTKQSQRQLKVWDPRNLSSSIDVVDLDQAAGFVMPFFDNDTNMLFLAGKGDGNVRFFEMSSDSSPFALSDHKTSVPAKGMAWVPKRGLDVSKNEVARLMKLTTNGVEPMSFQVPRKSDDFQEDIFPDTAGPIPAHSAEEWMAGSDLPPVLVSMNPSLRSDVDSSTPKAFVAAKSPAVLQQELDAANARIKELEDRLAAAGLSIN